MVKDLNLLIKWLRVWS